MEFKDRQGQNLNRKKIKIISQTPTEIIADIERYDDATEEGTLINANVFNTFQAQIDQASIKASSALSNVNDANNKSDEAKINANEALTKAKTALSNSETAINKASQLENALADRGATVYVGEEAKSTIYFDADPQIQLNNKVEKAKSTLSTVSADDLFIIKKSNSSENYNISLNTLMTAVLNVSYPIGAVYISFNSTNPGEIFGGTWEQINDKFLLSAGTSYAAGTQGGEATHILTTAEIPSHIHNNTFQVVNLTQDKHRHRVLTYTGHTRAGINNKFGQVLWFSRKWCK